MNTAGVDAAVTRVAAWDAQLGAHARTAAEWLTPGEGPEALHQAGIQDFLWWHLPRKFEPSRWDDFIAGAAELFDELGLSRYAAIARSRLTQDILGAWRFTPDDVYKRYREAASPSGVKAPDTDTFQWGSIMGINEAVAGETVERALERAIVSGDLVPGRSGWKRTAVRLCDETLHAPRTDDGGQTLLSLINAERAHTWVASARSNDHRAWRERTVARLLTLIPVPPEAAEVVAPLVWLLRRAAEGVALTQSGYIARVDVLEACDRFGWWDWEKAPRSETDVPQLGQLREAAMSLRLIRRSGRRLLATSKGKSIVGDPGRLWAEVAATLGGRDDFGKVVAELVGLRLLDGPAIDSDLEEALFSIIAAQGWMAGLESVEYRHVAHIIHRRLYWWRMLGLLDEERPRWENAQRIGQSRTGLTSQGEATVLAYLRGLATGPRTSVYG